MKNTRTIFVARRPNPTYNPISEQPQAIDNTFQLGPGERIVQTYECDERCCGCGDNFTVTLTDERVIQRRQNKTCCCSGGNADLMVFLSDISALQIEKTCCKSCHCSCDLCSLLMCCLCLPFFLCSGCCRNQGIPVSIDGAYGSRIFTFDRKSCIQAMGDIPVAAIPHKPSRNTYTAPVAPAARSNAKNVRATANQFDGF